MLSSASFAAARPLPVPLRSAARGQVHQIAVCALAFRGGQPHVHHIERRDSGAQGDATVGHKGQARWRSVSLFTRIRVAFNLGVAKLLAATLHAVAEGGKSRRTERLGLEKHQLLLFAGVVLQG